MPGRTSYRQTAIHNWLFKTKPLPLCMHLGWIHLVANDQWCEAFDRVDVAGEHAYTSSSFVYGQSSNYLGSLNTHKLYGYEHVINDRYSVAHHSTNQRKSYGWMRSAMAIAWMYIFTLWWPSLTLLFSERSLWLAFACTAYDHIISRADKALAICHWFAGY